MTHETVPYWRLSAFYFCFFGLLGALFPYWSLYLQSLGYTATEIGFLLAIPMATKVIAPNIWAWIADYTGERLAIIRLGALLACLCFAGIFIDQGFLAITLVMTGYSFFWNAVLPQQEVVTTSFLHQRPENYSRIRPRRAHAWLSTVRSRLADICFSSETTRCGSFFCSRHADAAVPWYLLQFFQYLHGVSRLQ